MRFYNLDIVRKKMTGSSLLIVLLIFISCHFIDARLALFILDALSPDFLLSDQVSNIPDLLTGIVCAITLFSWTGYFYLTHKGLKTHETQFLQHIGCSIPLSFFFKFAVKLLVGRINTRVWLLSPDLYGFHWFHGDGDYSGFPSGHMTVFTCLALGLLRFYPHYRYAYLAVLFSLSAALIATEYHFLGDVIGGAYLGWIVDEFTHRGLLALRRNRKSARQKELSS